MWLVKQEGVHSAEARFRGLPYHLLMLDGAQRFKRDENEELNC